MRIKKGKAFRTALKQPWLLTSACLLLVSLVLYGTTFFHSDEAVEQALLSGQRVEVELSTGEVFGGISNNTDNKLSENAPEETDQTLTQSPQAIAEQQTDTAETTEQNSPSLTSPAANSNAIMQAPELTADMIPDALNDLKDNDMSGIGPYPQDSDMQLSEALEGGSTEQTYGPMPNMPVSDVGEAVQAGEAVLPSEAISGQQEAIVDAQQPSPAATTNENAADTASPQLEGDPTELSAQEQEFTRKNLEKRRQKINLAGGKRPIVIVITGVGLSVRTTERVLEMPVNFSLGFSPYAPNVALWNKKAIVLGFDTLLHLPMETPDYSVDDPGPYAMVSTASAEDNMSRLEMLLALGAGYKGVYSSHNENFSDNINNIRPIVAGLADLRMPFLYGKGAGNVSLLQFAEQSNITMTTNDVMIDDVITYDAIMTQLAELEKMAEENEFAVGMARPYPLTLNTLKFWQKGLSEKQMEVVPFSLLIERLKQKGF